MSQMRKIVFYVLIPGIIMSLSCKNKEGITNFPTEEKAIELTPESMEMVSSDNEFGIEIFKNMLASDPSKNLLISPTSISQALLMAYNGADAETKTAFEKALFLGNLSVEKVNQGQKDLVKELLEVDPGVKINIANSVWIHDNFHVKPGFISVNQEYYSAEVEQLPFNETATKTINKWVDNKTNGKIEEIVGELKPDDVMVLLNAVYFKGNWKHKFEEASTVEDKFLLNEKIGVTVPFMNMTEDFKIYKHTSFSMLELPYGRGNYSMLILLPNQDKSVSDILKTLNNLSYQQWIGKLSQKEVEISIPKFKFAYDKTLNEVLKAMHLEIAFTSDADFSKISNEELFIGSVRHKSFIEVDEKGTEAAAATAITYATSSFQPNKEVFKANRPFLFIIREKYTNAILFTGKVHDPSKK